MLPLNLAASRLCESLQNTWWQAVGPGNQIIVWSFCADQGLISEYKLRLLTSMENPIVVINTVIRSVYLHNGSSYTGRQYLHDIQTAPVDDGNILLVTTSISWVRCVKLALFVSHPGVLGWILWIADVIKMVVTWLATKPSPQQGAEFRT